MEALTQTTLQEQATVKRWELPRNLYLPVAVAQIATDLCVASTDEPGMQDIRQGILEAVATTDLSYAAETAGAFSSDCHTYQLATDS